MLPPAPRSSVLLALPTTVPAVAEVKVAEKWPPASVGPLDGPAGLGEGPVLAVRLMVTGAPASTTKPAPSPLLISTVAVKVCEWPTTSVALGAMLTTRSSAISGSSPLLLVALLLSAVLALRNWATHWYVPATVGRKPPGLLPVASVVLTVPLPLTGTVSVWTGLLPESNSVNTSDPVGLSPLARVAVSFIFTPPPTATGPEGTTLVVTVGLAWKV